MSSTNGNSNNNADVNSPAINPKWDESSMAQLLGLKESDLSPPINSEDAESLKNQESDNVISQSELLEEPELDPQKAKTQPSLSSNPLAKFGLVGLGMFAVFFVGGLFLNNIMGTKIQPTPSAQQVQPPLAQKKDSSDNATETGKLKTELALGKQEEQLAALNRSKSPKNRDLTSQAKNPTSVEVTARNNPPTSVQRVAQQPYSPPPRTITRTEIRYVPQVRYVPQPVASRVPPAPTRSNPVPAPTRTERTPVTPVAVALQRVGIDPMKQWMSLAKLGSYGHAVVDENSNAQSGDEQVASTASGTINDSSSSVTSPVSVASVPQATPVIRTKTANKENKNATDEEASILARVPSDDVSNEEANILTGTPLAEVRNLQVGQLVNGTLATPVIWSGGTTADSRNGILVTASEKTQERAEQFVVRLEQPLVDDSGQVLLPSGSMAVFAVNSVHPSGLVNCDARALIVNGQEYHLPPGVISIRGEDGKPLTASKWDDKGPEIASMDASTAIFGSLANVGRILNQPRSEEYDDFDSGFGSRRRTRIDRGRPNLLGAVLEGGMTPLLQQIQRRNERAIAQIQARPNLWYVSANQKVTVFVNRSFDF
ncbi:TrbI/VirB10 family protein [Aerosakkonemataceae cyanobacterium BLCC-F50]|uniref:TrbI/VirB10 family protein n=1 Tax=Floridaenema flaviceps BLCC-F50 TaxID=3153642 RepID=A0ABV4Y1D3_9CYAN